MSRGQIRLELVERVVLRRRSPRRGAIPARQRMLYWSLEVGMEARVEWERRCRGRKCGALSGQEESESQLDPVHRFRSQRRTWEPKRPTHSSAKILPFAQGSSIIANPVTHQRITGHPISSPASTATSATCWLMIPADCRLHLSVRLAGTAYQAIAPVIDEGALDVGF